MSFSGIPDPQQISPILTGHKMKKRYLYEASLLHFMKETGIFSRREALASASSFCDMLVYLLVMNDALEYGIILSK